MQRSTLPKCSAVVPPDLIWHLVYKGPRFQIGRGKETMALVSKNSFDHAAQQSKLREFPSRDIYLRLSIGSIRPALRTGC
jgi:hypothetical protein